MRSYGQFCAVARSLDLIGDRWTLLIVRELLAGPARYSELRDGLPGIATNLLADRLRELEADELVEHDGERYALTPRGAELEPVLLELVRWGRPLMARGQGDDEFRGQWLHLALSALLHDVVVDHPVVVECTVDDAVVTITSGPDGTTVTDGPAPRADVQLTGRPDAMLILFGRGRPNEAQSGVQVTGSRAALRRLLRAAAAVDAAAPR
jgi:DNA-binding HxlR family transcriptional regulator